MIRIYSPYFHSKHQKYLPLNIQLFTVNQATVHTFMCHSTKKHFTSDYLFELKFHKYVEKNIPQNISNIQSSTFKIGAVTCKNLAGLFMIFEVHKPQYFVTLIISAGQCREILSPEKTSFTKLCPK